MVTTERACISICYGKINKQNHHPKCFDVSFEKQVQKVKAKPLFALMVISEITVRISKKKNRTWNLDEYFNNISISYSSYI